MIIVHKCQRCAHWEQSHAPGMCCHGFCPCISFVSSPSEGVTTYHAGTIHESEVVHEPGTYWNDESVGPAGSRMLLCGCEECHALYNALTGGVMHADGPSW